MRGMLRRWLILGSMCLLLVGTVTQAQDAAGDLLARINGLRSSLGLPGYSINGALSAAAQSQAQWMADNATITHNRPDGSGPRTRAVNAGYGTTDVSENIYGGTNASVDSAWTFWINSAVHYRGLTNSRYQHIGIGAARSGWGATYVLVFGNPGGPPPFVAQVVSGNSAGSGFVEPPSYVIGVDPHGFIMHEIQPEDTLGDIALIYGYTWDDIPYMMAINGLADNRSLQIGEVFLVPPYDGTYTPTPGGAEPTAEVIEAAAEIAAVSTATPPPTATVQPSPTRMIVATAAAMPEVIALVVAAPSATPMVAAAASTEVMLASSIITDDRPSTALIVALILQVGLLLVAAVEFLRRARRRT